MLLPTARDFRRSPDWKKKTMPSMPSTPHSWLRFYGNVHPILSQSATGRRGFPTQLGGRGRKGECLCAGPGQPFIMSLSPTLLSRLYELFGRRGGDHGRCARVEGRKRGRVNSKRERTFPAGRGCEALRQGTPSFFGSSRSLP